MSKSYTVQIPQLGGGINCYVGPEMIGVDEAQRGSRNTRSIGTGFRSRNGYTTYADTLTGGDRIAAFGNYTRNLAANDRLVMAYNNNLYDIDTTSESSWSLITDSFFTDDTNVDMVAFRDWLFIFNGVDKPIRLADTTTSQPIIAPASVSTANFTPAFGDTGQNSLFVGGVPTAPNVCFVSKASTDANPEYVYDFSGTLTSFGDAQALSFPSRVTAIRKLSDAVVIFTESQAFYCKGLTSLGSTVLLNVQPIAGSSGAVSQKSTCVVENDIYYLTPNKEIKSLKRGFSDQTSIIVTPLSVKIQNILNEEIDNNLTDSFAYYDQANKLYKIYFRAKDAGLNTIRVVGDINKLDAGGVPAWGIDDAVPFSCGIYYKGQAYTGSTVIGQVYKDEDGLADDDDVGIVTRRLTKEFNSGNPTTVKRFKEVVVFGDMTVASTGTIVVYVDGIEAARKTLDYNDIPSASVGTDGGIATDVISEFTLGEEGQEVSSTYFEFIKRIPFRQTGRRIRIEFLTDGINNDIRPRNGNYSFIALSPTFNPIIEK